MPSSRPTTRWPLGALEVLKSRGKTGDLLLVGYDGTEEATVAQNPYKMGLVGVKEAANAATYKSVPKTINTGVTSVTPENVKSYLQEYRERLGKQ